MLLFWKTKIFQNIISADEPIAPDLSVVALNASNLLIQIAKEKETWNIGTGNLNAEVDEVVKRCGMQQRDTILPTVFR